MRTEFTHLQLFCGIGGGSLGFKWARQEYGGKVGRFRALAGIDADPGACENYERITGGRAVCMDLFSRQQYIDFHGHEPPPGWREATPVDILDACGGEYPDVIFTSPPCKGFSGLLPEKSAQSRKYQALNQLTTRGIRLCLEAFADDLPGLIILENVPRIRTRGKTLLDEIKKLLRKHGYVVNERNHDCGELGGLGQRRLRYLLVARNPRKLNSLLYLPEKKPLKTIGDVIGPLPMPGDVVAGGPMHRLPRLEWKTWVRLALIPAGGDWRDLNRIPWEQYRIVYKPRGGAYAVEKWDEPCRAVTSTAGPGRSNGVTAVADPRVSCAPRSGTFGVQRWDEPAKTVIGSGDIHAGAAAVADPRIPADDERGEWIIIAEDGTWHRPLTTFELAMLQGFPRWLPDGRPFQLTGSNSDAKWREWIGNAVPPKAAQAIAEEMLLTLMASSVGDFIMSWNDIWVRPAEVREIQLVQ